jgi:FtsH-binding integral membrane protein
MCLLLMSYVLDDKYMPMRQSVSSIYYLAVFVCLASLTKKKKFTLLAFGIIALLIVVLAVFFVYVFVKSPFEHLLYHMLWYSCIVILIKFAEMTRHIRSQLFGDISHPSE